jgi:hypothetical protein
LLQNRDDLAGHNFANIASSGSARSSAKLWQASAAQICPQTALLRQLVFDRCLYKLALQKS